MKKKDEMTRFIIRLAGIPIEVYCLYPGSRDFCRKYLSEEAASFTVYIEQGDIELERLKSEQKSGSISFSDVYLERLAIYRKIAEKMPDFNVFLFHGSAVAVDGEVYLFAARSGTGKSTHTGLWRQHFGERAVMVNDDKPLIRITEKEIRVCGTPWNGKHGLGTNVELPLKAVCILTRAGNNHIEPLTSEESYPFLLKQIYRPVSIEKLMKTLVLLDRLVTAVPCYRLGCNMEPEAAAVAYEGMNR